MRPVIGITTLIERKPRKSVCSVYSNYINAIYMAGGIPLPIPIIPGAKIAENYMEMIDGVLFTGGEDISPLLYGEDPINEIGAISVERDTYEFELFSEAVKRAMPILGICRGIQLINAASGGTLYQDVYKQVEGCLGHSPSDIPVHSFFHRVNILKDSRLESIFGKQSIPVNSSHHQAVKRIGHNLKVTAVANDGIIEGIESTDSKFIVGVQWHPEDLISEHAEFMALFKAFTVEASLFSKAKLL